jgi:hypothetical protein
VEKIMHELAVRGDCVFTIFLYGRSFYVSRVGGKIDDLWFDIGSEALEPYTKVRSNEDVIAFIRQHVPDAPINDRMIIFNMHNAVCKALRDKGIKLR